MGDSLILRHSVRQAWKYSYYLTAAIFYMCREAAEQSEYLSVEELESLKYVYDKIGEILGRI